MLVDRTPQQVRFATQCDERVVEVPRATRLASRRFDPVSEALAKLIAPASDCLVCHGHTALEEQFLDVAQAQLKAKVPAHSATDDLGWETVTVIERFRFLHHAILRDRASNLTTPSGLMGVFPGEDALDGAEALIENGRIEQRLATMLRGCAATRIGVDVGLHGAIENGLAVGPAVVDAIQTDDGAAQIKANRTGGLRELGQRLTQQW